VGSFEFVERGLAGPAIGAAMEKARITAIAAVPRPASA
jgi:hypothetical protein